jgi:GTP-binding protein Era
MHRSGFVTLIGAPNAGKSTFLNKLSGKKLSIVSHKRNTTRTLVRGIVNHMDSQIILVDTPGLGQALERSLLSGIWDTVEYGDILLLIVDVQSGMNIDVLNILSRLGDMNLPKILVLNKIDRVNPPVLLGLAKSMNDRILFDRTFMVSALKGFGCSDVLDFLAQIMPMGFLNDPEDQDLHLFASEITREKLYLYLHDELPYTLMVETELWEECKDGSVSIRQIISVERESHKKIVLGSKGRKIKMIGQSSRRELAESLDKPVHLFLFVQVRNHSFDHPISS